jgi:hypothetical protein
MDEKLMSSKEDAVREGLYVRGLLAIDVVIARGKGMTMLIPFLSKGRRGGMTMLIPFRPCFR